MVNHCKGIQCGVDRIGPRQTGAGDIDGRGDATRIGAGERGACSKGQIGKGFGHVQRQVQNRDDRMLPRIDPYGDRKPAYVQSFISMIFRHLQDLGPENFAVTTPAISANLMIREQSGRLP
jgi:hypothetical protein